DDEDGPLEIVAHGSKRDMAFLETRIGYWQRLDDQFGKKQPTATLAEASNHLWAAGHHDLARAIDGVLAGSGEEIGQREPTAMNDDYARGYDAGFLVGAQKGRSEPTEAQIEAATVALYSYFGDEQSRRFLKSVADD